MRKLRAWYPTVASTLALFVALTGAYATASGSFITSKQIKNGTIVTQDIRKNGVRTSDIQNGAVGGVDIGDGQVTPTDVTMPPPVQIELAPGDAATINAGNDFALVRPVGTYGKQDPTSRLEVQWTGTAAADFSPCVFQLRVDGQPSAGSAGSVYVSNGSALSVSVVSLFGDLPTGPHRIEVWARITGGGGASYPCTVGPAFAEIGQTFVVGERVI